MQGEGYGNSQDFSSGPVATVKDKWDHWRDTDIGEDYGNQFIESHKMGGYRCKDHLVSPNRDDPTKDAPPHSCSQAQIALGRMGNVASEEVADIFAGE